MSGQRSRCQQCSKNPSKVRVTIKAPHTLYEVNTNSPVFDMYTKKITSSATPQDLHWRFVLESVDDNDKVQKMSMILDLCSECYVSRGIHPGTGYNMKIDTIIIS